MKNLKSILLTLAIQIAISNSVNGQNNQIGLDIGYGTTQSIDDDHGFSSPNYKNVDNYYRVGVIYYLTTGKTNLNLLTGVNLDYNSESDINLAYIKVPLGIEMGLETIPRFVYGGGLFISGLIYYNGISESSDFEGSLNKIQFGIFANFGFEHQISPKYTVGINFQTNIDITKLYEEYTSSPGGTPYTIRKGKGADIFVKLSLKYSFQND